MSHVQARIHTSAHTNYLGEEMGRYLLVGKLFKLGGPARRLVKNLHILSFHCLPYNQASFVSDGARLGVDQLA